MLVMLWGLYDKAPDAPMDHSPDPHRTGGGAIGRVRLLAVVALRLRPGGDRADGQTPLRAARVPGVLVRPDLHARRGSVVGRATHARARRHSHRLEAAAPDHERGDRRAALSRPDARRRSRRVA